MKMTAPEMVAVQAWIDDVRLLKREAQAELIPLPADAVDVHNSDRNRWIEARQAALRQYRARAKQLAQQGRALLKRSFPQNLSQDLKHLIDRVAVAAKQEFDFKLLEALPNERSLQEVMRFAVAIDKPSQRQAGSRAALQLIAERWVRVANRYLELDLTREIDEVAGEIKTYMTEYSLSPSARRVLITIINSLAQFKKVYIVFLRERDKNSNPVLDKQGNQIGTSVDYSDIYRRTSQVLWEIKRQVDNLFDAVLKVTA